MLLLGLRVDFALRTDPDLVPSQKHAGPSLQGAQPPRDKEHWFAETEGLKERSTQIKHNRRGIVFSSVRPGP